MTEQWGGRRPRAGRPAGSVKKVSVSLELLRSVGIEIEQSRAYPLWYVRIAGDVYEKPTLEEAAALGIDLLHRQLEDANNRCWRLEQEIERQRKIQKLVR